MVFGQKRALPRLPVHLAVSGFVGALLWPLSGLSSLKRARG